MECREFAVSTCSLENKTSEMLYAIIYISVLYKGPSYVYFYVNYLMNWDSYQYDNNAINDDSQAKRYPHFKTVTQ